MDSFDNFEAVDYAVTIAPYQLITINSWTCPKWVILDYLIVITMKDVGYIKQGHIRSDNTDEMEALLDNNQLSLVALLDLFINFLASLHL